MEGSYIWRTTLVARHGLCSPRDAWRWMRDRIESASPLQRRLPWFSWGAIDHLRNYLRPGMRVFEWGCGGSTLFFVDHDCEVTTVESSVVWQSRLLDSIGRDADGGRIKIRMVPAENEDLPAIARYVNSVHDGAPWDVVVVDGLEGPHLSRTHCVATLSRDTLKRGGVVIVDDAYRAAYSRIPELLAPYRRKIFKGLGPCRLGVTQTDIYYAD